MNTTKKIINNKKNLLIIFLISFLIRAFFFVFILEKNNACWVCKDSFEYNTVAVNIALNNSITNSEGISSFYRVPGYSVFLGLIYKIFDINIIKALFTQIFLVSFIPILIYYLSLILFPENILLAYLSSIVSVFNFSFVFNSGLLMSDSLFILFLLLFLIFFYKNLYIFSGLFLGIASLIRPVGVYLVILSIILIFCYLNSPRSSRVFLRKQKCIEGLILFLSWAFIVSFWLIRNFCLTGNIFFHTMSGYHFLSYYAVEVYSKANNMHFYLVRDKFLNEYESKVKEQEFLFNKKLNDLDKEIIAQNIANKYIQKYKLISLKVAIVNMIKTVLSLNSSYIVFIDQKEFKEYKPCDTLFARFKRLLFPDLKHKFYLIFIYWELVFLSFILLGFSMFFISSLFNYKIFLNYIGLYLFIFLFIFLTLGSGVARLRLPIEPILIILSSYFWIEFYKSVKQKKLCLSQKI